VYGRQFRGYQFDVLAYLERCAAAVRSAGGMIVTGCRLVSLELLGDRVAMANVVDRDGITRIETRATLLATGGFQADPDLRRSYIGADAAERLLLRGCSFCVGDGLQAARAVGAAASGSGFYGHLVAYPLPRFEPSDFARLSQEYCVHGLLLNQEGRRFVDESLGYSACAQATLDAARSRALLVTDSRVHGRYAVSALAAGGQALDRAEEARREGANVARAESLTELERVAFDWGYDGTRVIETVSNFNLAASRGVVQSGEPARRRLRTPLDCAPYFAIEVQPAITTSNGGLHIDVESRVLSTSGLPVPGLFAAGADAAWAFGRGYAGGLANAVVFGRIAARRMAEYQDEG
jgi:succinate dehydrogenase/fumarate reductase flavoprotein subunit